jgi:hypothetical protein
VSFDSTVNLVKLRKGKQGAGRKTQGRRLREVGIWIKSKFFIETEYY